MRSCITVPMRSRSNKVILILYIIFAAYVVYVAIFLASMLFRSASDIKAKAKGLPNYMSDTEIDEIRVSESGSLDQQLQEAFKK